MTLVISIRIKIIHPIVQNDQEANQLSEQEGTRENSRKDAVIVEDYSVGPSNSKVSYQTRTVSFSNENLLVCTRKSQESSARCSDLMLYLTTVDVDVADV